MVMLAQSQMTVTASRTFRPGSFRRRGRYIAVVLPAAAVGIFIPAELGLKVSSTCLDGRAKDQVKLSLSHSIQEGNRYSSSRGCAGHLPGDVEGYPGWLKTGFWKFHL